MLRESVMEKEVFEARVQAKAAIESSLAGLALDEGPEHDLEAAGSYLPEITYDESGRPRPNLVAYDSHNSDVPYPHAVVPDDVDDEDDADDRPFPNLFPPLG